jgi:peptide/nickel transport system substrate-binding protein
LASSLAAGAAGAFGVVPSFGKAQNNVLYVRFDSDIAVLDPGYMVGGTEIETQKAVMPALVEYATMEDGYINPL